MELIVVFGISVLQFHATFLQLANFAEYISDLTLLCQIIRKGRREFGFGLNPI